MGLGCRDGGFSGLGIEAFHQGLQVRSEAIMGSKCIWLERGQALSPRLTEANREYITEVIYSGSDQDSNSNSGYVKDTADSSEDRRDKREDSHQ